MVTWIRIILCTAAIVIFSIAQWRYYRWQTGKQRMDAETARTERHKLFALIIIGSSLISMSIATVALKALAGIFGK